MISILVAASCLALASIPAVLFTVNLRRYRPPVDGGAGRIPPGISVLIPARNESGSIEAAVISALSQEGVDLEVIVGDDQSTDDTRSRVAALARRDPRLRLVEVPALPPGWCGKQWACSTLAAEARRGILVFVDADVRLEPSALRRMTAFREQSGAALVSGVPRQEVGSPLETLLIPLIHFVLLGFLPLGRMRSSSRPEYGAGCGQLFLARRDAYEACGGHAAIRDTLHDGLRLPRLFRQAGYATDLCDATDIAVTRMYRSAREVWNGLSKNAVEGLGSPGLIVPATALLLVGQALPAALLAGLLVAGGSTPALLIAGAAAGASYWPRLLACRRFRQPIAGSLLHPIGIVVLLAIQWSALIRWMQGLPVVWRGRVLVVEPPSTSRGIGGKGAALETR